MIEQASIVAYGREASEALAAAIARAKADAPLAPVTVIVPSNFAGLTARRLLGAGVVGPGGLANVSFLTPFRLAELLAADQLLATRPLTNPVLGAAVRKALADDPGPFARVAEHEATEAALSSLYAELSNVSASALERMGAHGGSSAAAAVRMFRTIAGHLGGFHGEAEVARAAAARPDLADALGSFGPVIWYLPAPTTAPMADFVGAVLAGGNAEAAIIIGITGDAAADQAVRDTCRRAGVTVAEGAATPTPGSGPTPPTADRLVSVTDADEEVRSVVRDILHLAESGVALDRIGVFFPAPDPYLAILEQQLAAAEMPANGPSQRTLAHCAAGRTLLGALDLPAQRWRRDRVMQVVSGAPVRQGDGAARPGAWEALSRQAGVVADLPDWHAKLARLRLAVTQRRDACDPELDAPQARRLDRELADIDQLEQFVIDLAAAVGAVDTATTWDERCAAARSLLHQLLGPGHRHRRWPEHEQADFDRVEDALARLAALGELEPAPSSAVFIRALIAELAASAGRAGRFGHGVTYGPLGAAAGHDLDAVFVVGCVEGLCPSPRREDALLPDAARTLSAGELTPRSARLADQHRAFLAALAAAPPGRRTLTAPRGDLRGGRQPLPSRWLLDSATALSGAPVYATEFADLPASVVHVVPSFATGLLHAPTPASIDERDVAALHAVRTGGGDPTTHAVAALVARGLTAQRARRSPAFTEWDGNLSGQPIPSTADVPMSASRLQAWATCGFQYFLESVLRLRERDDPERVVDLDPRDRGSAVHLVLERFILEAIDQGAPDPDQPWSPAQRRRLDEIARQVFAEVEAEGRTGRAVHWTLVQADLLQIIHELLDADDEFRSTKRATPISVELPFGLKGREPVTFTLDDGRTLAFRGLADRVDRAEDGRLLVSDYKTGRGSGYKDVHEGDPVKGGTMLQLGLYAEAALQQLGGDEAEAHYWMVDTASRYMRHGYAWTPERRRRFLEVVTAIADGVEAGVFPAVPGEWDTWRNTHETCTYCDFDKVCPRGRGEQATIKLAAPELRRRDALAWEVQP